MNKADNGYNNLTQAERDRNRRTGEVFLFVHTNKVDPKRLKNLESFTAEDRMFNNSKVKPEDEERTVGFGQSDLVEGKCFRVQGTIQLGQKLTKREVEEVVVITESNQV